MSGSGGLGWSEAKPRCMANSPDFQRSSDQEVRLCMANSGRRFRSGETIMERCMSDSHSELIKQYLAGPRMVVESVEGMDAAQLRASPVAGRWSTLEVVCHLADTEALYAER